MATICGRYDFSGLKKVMILKTFGKSDFLDFFEIWCIDIYIDVYFINSFKRVLFKSIWVLVLTEGT